MLEVVLNGYFISYMTRPYHTYAFVTNLIENKIVEGAY